MHKVDNLLSTLARQKIAVLTKAVQQRQHHRVGISSVFDSILEQHVAGAFVDPLGALGVGLGFQRIDSSKKTRLSGVSLTDLALPDSSPIFTHATYSQHPPTLVGAQAPTTLPPSMLIDPGDTHSSNVNSRYDTREFYAHIFDAFDMGGMHLISDYNTDTASDGTTIPPQSTCGGQTGRT
ncbi:hypothetical protein DXG01_009055 [Tephrocybe rancida]|nr:hypothetical protein DXG01_009055 [Tephrocybe rancida]